MPHEYEKTHHECHCRDCDPMVAAAERLDIWKTAHKALTERSWPSSYDVDPRDVLILAHWLLHQEDASDSGDGGSS
ncbi:hypothetical protein [Streptomyces sp. CC53]|uniref:hypothetical protein n=1 Tax=Streptomyces sp. CC53 TaxID=1906740 RepID=UPI00115F8651|nr:hypothetical protein [Streptomyces sp. CC53]